MIGITFWLWEYYSNVISLGEKQMLPWVGIEPKT